MGIAASLRMCFLGFVPVSVSAATLSGQGHAHVNILDRTAHVYAPDSVRNATDGNYGAIFVLHGSGGVAEHMFNKGFEAQADANGFLVVYPEMKVARSDSWGYAKDIPYFTALVQRLQEKDYRLDPARVFVCGHSAGGTMSLFLQNEVDLFCGAGAVEGAVGHLNGWDMQKRGHPTIVVWNHADPVLEVYSPEGGEPGYYDLTVSTLRRHGSKTFLPQPLLLSNMSETLQSAEFREYPEDEAPKLVMLGFKTEPGTHDWAHPSWASFCATAELVKFFLGIPSAAPARRVR